ncbi:hypothetical protein [Rhizobium mongolense]|uniref:Uncharacterized protein n=2 Tax=Rhizobium mongolense TaxID=57676 RepID=A0ABR6IY38_9HYPH|nr:hypothetical protein [Rhizobium mongolense]MBB4232841.1 hypothetical protein [Rhizobium mongolense]TVZ75115.1 hypothetical protein BCL32_0528 [Rhizobium mongolense USDA 1844]
MAPVLFLKVRLAHVYIAANRTLLPAGFPRLAHDEEEPSSLSTFATQGLSPWSASLVSNGVANGEHCHVA